jgi:hypothetical protein
MLLNMFKYKPNTSIDADFSFVNLFLNMFDYQRPGAEPWSARSSRQIGRSPPSRRANVHLTKRRFEVSPHR